MATITSPDGNYTATVNMFQDPNGIYVVEVDVSATASYSGGDTINVRVNGNLVWEGTAAESQGGG